MTGGCSADDRRTVTIHMDSEVYGWLVADARATRRTPAARAGELFHLGLAAQRGPSGDNRLDDLARRLNEAGRATTTLPAVPVTRPEAVAPPPAAEAPKRKTAALRMREADIRLAALSARGLALRGAFDLSPVEAAVLDGLLAGGEYHADEIRALLPQELRPRTVGSIQASIAQVRDKTGLGHEHLLHIGKIGYCLSQQGRATVLAKIGAAT